MKANSPNLGRVKSGWYLALLLALCFTLATALQLWFQNWHGSRAQSGDLMEVLLGDSRRLFANHFFVQADVYFHGGYYPSVFDQTQPPKTLHIAETSATPADHHDGELDDMPEFLKKPGDWIDRFGRNFYPTKHEHQAKPTNVREILPWLRFSAELDPNNIQTYTVAGYWLRVHLGKIDEAEQFLRAGLRANPGNPEILFELGRVYEENRHDDDRARNIWEAALRQAQSAGQGEPDKIFLAKIMGHLVRLEERTGHLNQALYYLKQILPLAVDPPAIQRQISELEQKILPPQ